MWINKGKKVPLMGFQTGGYIPGLSGAQFRGQLGSDIRQTQEDIEEQSRDIAKHEKKRGWLQKAGSWLGEKGLQYAMMSNPATAALMATPLGSAATKGIGSGLGRFIGGKAAGKGQAIEESSTGLLGGQYDTLKDIQKSNEEAQLGEAVKAGGTRFLTAGGSDYAKNYAKAKVPGLSKVFGEEGAALPESPELEMTGTMDKVFEMPDEVTRLELPASNPLVEDVAVGGGGDPMTTPQLIEDYMAEGGYVKGYENGGTIRGATPYSANINPEGVLQQIMEVPASEVGGGGGSRYYLGEGNSPNFSLAKQLAGHDAMVKMQDTPQDSIPSNLIDDYFSEPKQAPKKGIMGLLGFQNGGNVPLFNPMSSHGAIDQLMVDNLYEQMPQRMSHTSRGPRLMEVDPGVDYEMRRPAPVQDAELSDKDLMDLLNSYGASEFGRIFGRQDRRLGMLPRRHFHSPEGLAPKPLPRR